MSMRRFRRSVVFVVFVFAIPVEARDPVRPYARDLLRAPDAQPYPVTGTAGFETGIVTLGTINGTLGSKNDLMRPEPRVDWGDGQTTPAMFANCSGLRDRRDCDVVGTHVYEDPGSYTVTVTYSLRSSGSAMFTTTATITEASGFVVLSIGDSVASGEGDPVTPTSDEPAQWDDVQSNAPPYDPEDPDNPEGHKCHRSSLAGPALAAAMLQETNEGVTFIHQACSGAKVDGIIEQLAEARSHLSRIDVLLISGGANNIGGGFGAVINRCIDPSDGRCSEDDGFKTQLAESFEALPGEYARLASAIDCANDECTEAQRPSLVVISEYFDPTRDRHGDYPGHVVSTSCVGHLIAPQEWEFLYDEMVVPLNQAVASAAQTYSWVLADGIAEAFAEHGYCASAGPGGSLGNTWIVKLPDSVANQSDLDSISFPICFVQDDGCDADISGTGHPNEAGQEVYAEKIHAAIVANNPPITSASLTAGGSSYKSGSVTRRAVVVSLGARNHIGEAGVGYTYFAVDEPACTAEPSALGHCAVYSGPFLIDEPGRHTVTFFSENGYGLGLEAAKTVEVVIDH